MPADEFTLKVSILIGFFAVLSLVVNRYFRVDPMLDAIPTVGFSDPILSYFSALRFNFDSVRMLKEGYESTRPGISKVAIFRRWVVLATGSELIEDVGRAPEDILSRTEPVNEDCLVHSARIHTRHIEPGRYIHHGRNPFQINARCCSYIQGGPPRARRGYG
jgi:hypothetical protein